MFIATVVTVAAKLRRSGMNGRVRRSATRVRPHAAPTELGWTFWLLLTINMALLTELSHRRSPFCGQKGAVARESSGAFVNVRTPAWAAKLATTP